MPKPLYNPNYDYVSWISNVSGRLFFHLTGKGYNYRHDRIVGDIVHINKKYNNERIFFISMLVDLRDEPRIQHSKYTRVIIASHTQELCCESKFIEGDIYLIDDEKHTGLYKSCQDKDFLYKLKKNIKEKDNYQTFNETVNTFLNHCNKLNQSTKKTEQRVNHIHFKLEETGIVFLTKKDNLKVINSKEDPDIKSAFYILKFTFHKDRYHSMSAENIIRIISRKEVEQCIQEQNKIKVQPIKWSISNKKLPLAPYQYKDIITINKKFSSPSGDEIIAKLLLEGIKKYIAEKRKLEHNNFVFYNLKGVISYSKTLVNIFNIKLKVSTKNEKIKSNFIKDEEIYLNNIEMTLDRELEKLEPLSHPTFYTFISELKSILFLPLLFLTFSLAILRLLDMKINNILIFSDMINFFIILIGAGIIVVELKRILNIMQKTYLTKKITQLPFFILNIIKKYSQPNLKSKYNPIFIVPKYIFPNIINIEMWFRRTKRSKNKFINICNIILRYLVIFSLFTAISMMLYNNLELTWEESKKEVKVFYYFLELYNPSSENNNST